MKKQVFVDLGAESVKVGGILQKIYGPDVEVFWSEIKRKVQTGGKIDVFFLSAYAISNVSINVHEMVEQYGSPASKVIAVFNLPQHGRLAMNGNHGVTYLVDKAIIFGPKIYDHEAEERAQLFSFLTPTRISA